MAKPRTARENIARMVDRERVKKLSHGELVQLVADLGVIAISYIDLVAKSEASGDGNT